MIWVMLVATAIKAHGYIQVTPGWNGYYPNQESCEKEIQILRHEPTTQNLYCVHVSLSK